VLVDDEKIDTLEAELRPKLQEAEQYALTLKYALRNVLTIQMVDAPDPTSDNPNQTKKVLPLDPSFNETISDTRREEIYDKLVADEPSWDL